jgi:HPt (histidine-containing phosphotransfer) domain-containing protein
MMPDQPALDPTTLEMLESMQTRDDPGFVRELFDLYLATSRDDLPALERALEKGDRETVRKVAHRLKGASGNVGAQVMRTLCEQIELGAHAGPGFDLHDACRRLRAEQLRVEESIQRYARGHWRRS